MRFRRTYGVSAANEFTIAHAVSDALDGGDYESGRLETVEGTARNTMEAFGKLVQMLHENGALTDDNVRSLASFRYEEIK